MNDDRAHAAGPGAVSLLQVALQFAGIGLALWPFAPATGHPAALLPAAAGAGLGLWTLAHNHLGNFSVFPEPRAGATLVTTGPYAHVRHPMYGALLLVMAGAALWHGHLPNACGVALVTIAVFAKARREERLLRRRFAGYDDYRRRTRWMIPGLL